MNIFKHILTRYRCARCELGYTASPETEKQVLHGVCWSCTWLEGISYAQQDHYFAFLEQDMDEIDFRENLS